MKRTLGLTLLLFATLFSCMRQEKPLPAELSRAESVMWEHPDSALLCLSSLDSSIMNEPENIRMYHALLKIKAKDKLYIPHESDSLIKSIVQYYEDGGILLSRKYIPGYGRCPKSGESFSRCCGHRER